MSAIRTWIPTLPVAFVAAWRKAYLRECRATSILGAGGGVLEPLVPDAAIDQRTLKYGPAWRWMGMKPDEKRYWESLG